MENEMETTTIYGIILGITLGLYWGNGKENGNYYKDSSHPRNPFGVTL